MTALTVGLIAGIIFGVILDEVIRLCVRIWGEGRLEVTNHITPREPVRGAMLRPIRPLGYDPEIEPLDETAHRAVEEALFSTPPHSSSPWPVPQSDLEQERVRVMTRYPVTPTKRVLIWTGDGEEWVRDVPSDWDDVDAAFQMDMRFGKDHDKAYGWTLAPDREPAGWTPARSINYPVTP